MISRRLFGYQSVNEYYDKNSSINCIQNIKVPALFINSKDDPIIDYRWIPTEVFSRSENMILVLTQKGGHIDYFTNDDNGQLERWVYQPAI